MTTYPAPGTRAWHQQIDAAIAAEEAEVIAMENAEQHTTHHHHCRCGDTLRDRAAQALRTGMEATWGEAPTLVDARDLIDGVFNSAGVDDEAQRLRAERDQQAQDAAYYRDGRNLGYQLTDMARAEQDKLRAELGRIAELCGDDESNPDHAVALVRRQEHEDRTTIDRLIGERDQARAERDRWRRLAGEQESRRIAQETRADELEARVDEAAAILDSDQPDRCYQALQSLGDENSIQPADDGATTAGMRAERDRLHNELGAIAENVGHRDDGESVLDAVERLRAERDALQARIDNTLALAKQYRTINDDTVYALAAEVTERLSPVLPADDSSETEDLVLTPQETREFEQELLESRLQDQAGEFCRVDLADTAKRERDELQPGQPDGEHGSWQPREGDRVKVCLTGNHPHGTISTVDAFGHYAGWRQVMLGRATAEPIDDDRGRGSYD